MPSVHSYLRHLLLLSFGMFGLLRTAHAQQPPIDPEPDWNDPGYIDPADQGPFPGGLRSNIPACSQELITAPRDLNVCRYLIEELLVPAAVVPHLKCDIDGLECLALPHCCVPGACLAFPECVVTEQVVSAAEYVVHAGDVYCGLQEVSAEHLLDDLKNDRITDLAQITTGGLNSTLYTVAGSYIDALSCGAQELPAAFADVVRSVMTLPGFPSAFTEADVSRVRVISADGAFASVFLPDDKNAITLDGLVIIRGEIFDRLAVWAYDWSTAGAGSLTAEEMKPLFLMLHELTHVRQYRELGREAFVNNYLVSVIQNGYADASFEEEAYSVSDGNSSWAESNIKVAP
jgi:hypothetical protein